MVLKGYPRLSETFIAQEILELQRAGFDLEIISLRRPTDKAMHPVHREITAAVHYLPEYLHEEPMRVLKAWWACRRLPGYRKAFSTFIRDLRRDFTRNRLRRFGQALVLAHERTPSLAFLYAHFIHTPTSAARYGAMMSGLGFAVSSHAKDIWTSPAWELSEKLGDCEWCVTCTSGGQTELASHAPDPERVHLVYHGIDLSRFPRSPTGRKGARHPGSRLEILTVGRAVAKKGIDTLIEALALLPSGLDWRWTHIGGGPLKADLIKMVEARALSDRCRFLGALPQAEVLEAYRGSDLFVLPSRVDDTGDRDGLPNVIVEAQSQALAVISTPVSGIPELIEDGRNGILVEPQRPQLLADAIERLALDAGLRNHLGQAGEAIVRSRFDHKQAIVKLVALLKGSLGEGSGQHG